MNKTDSIAKTLREIGTISLQTEPASSDEQDDEELIISILQDVLPADVDMRIYKDFRHLNALCCETCHNFCPHYDMTLIDLPDGG